MSETPAIFFHPQPDETGAPVPVFRPTPATAPGTWLDPQARATYSVTERARLPKSLNGVAFTHESLGTDDWARFIRLYRDFPEPPEPESPKRRTSGVVMVEPDHRIWIVHPTNQFGDVEATFPKGRLEPGLTLLVNALKECWEESGLVAQPLAYLCDVERTKTVTRYYLARRTAGSPADVSWESQAVTLVPAHGLLALLNRPNDRRILPFLAEALNAANQPHGSGKPHKSR